MSEHSMNPRGKLLLFLISGDPVMAAIFSRYSYALSLQLNADVITVSEMRSGKKVKAAVDRFGNSKFFNLLNTSISAFLINFRDIVGSVLSVKLGSDLLGLRICDVPVGMHIYDSILRREAVSSVQKISLKQRFFILIELVYYHACKKLISDINPDFVVLPDNTYRQGPLFEFLQKFWKGDLFVGIDINSLTVHRYKCPVFHPRHCRTPSLELIERMEGDLTMLRDAKLYFDRRKLGNQAQHDVIRAYDSSKSMVSRDDLHKAYNLNPKKKIVLVMAHVFSDAPHAYPDVIFQDYKEWLIETCQILQANPRVEFLIKEHPSASLYCEEGMIEKILEEHSFKKRLLNKNINTGALFSAVDYIVTCGGTAAMEFAAEGVPVVVASKPPYSGLGFCSVADDLVHYRSILASIHEIKQPDKKSRTRALLCLYAINHLYGIDRKSVGFGSQDIFKGALFSEDVFFEEFLHTGYGSEEFGNFLEEIKNFINSNDSNLISFSKI
jgi:hypothetical protein